MKNEPHAGEWPEWNAREYASSNGTASEEEETPLSPTQRDDDAMIPTPFERFYHPSIPRKHLRFLEQLFCCCMFSSDVTTNIQEYVVWNVFFTFLSVGIDVYQMHDIYIQKLSHRKLIVAELRQAVSLTNDVLSLCILLWFYLRICRVDVEKLPHKRIVKGAVLSFVVSLVYFGECVWILYSMQSLSDSKSHRKPVFLLLDLVNGFVLVWTWLCMLYLCYWALMNPASKDVESDDILKSKLMEEESVESDRDEASLSVEYGTIETLDEKPEAIEISTL